MYQRQTGKSSCDLPNSLSSIHRTHTPFQFLFLCSTWNHVQKMHYYCTLQEKEQDLLMFITTLEIPTQQNNMGFWKYTKWLQSTVHLKGTSKTGGQFCRWISRQRFKKKKKSWSNSLKALKQWGIKISVLKQLPLIYVQCPALCHLLWKTLQ